MRTKIISVGLVLAALAGLLIFSADRICTAAQEEAKVRISGLEEKQVIFSFDGLPLPQKAYGSIACVIKDLDGNILGQKSGRYTGTKATLGIPANLKKDELPDYILSYQLNGQAEYINKSLFFLVDRLETIVLGQRDYYAGSRPSLRVIVKNKSQDRLVSGALVKITLDIGETKGKTLFEGRTDARGTVNAKLSIPDVEDSGKLNVSVQTEFAADEVNETITIKKGRKILLSTDKPLYQPGQTIHIRTLSLRVGDQKPQAGQEIVLEVEDAKGNKVFKQVKTTGKFGVASADFILANELNMGRYTVRAVMGATEQEKTVTVERYVLPKFKIKFDAKKSYYRPGDKLSGDIQADYFFGKPVSNGKVKVKLSKFDVGFEEFASIEGTTDKEGHYKLEADLPDYFVGQPLEQGKAFVKIDIEVTDTADHKEKLTRNIAVSKDAILAIAVPESGALIPGLENIIYLVTTYPDGTPAGCKLSVDCSDGKNARVIELLTDQSGFGQIKFTPQGREVKLNIRGADNQGNKVASAVTLTSEGKTEQNLLLRCNKALYKAGEKIAVNIFSTKKKGTVYLDLIKNGQTLLTKAVDLADGKASLNIDADANMAGTLCLNGYIISGDGNTVRDKKVILVDPANDLKIEVFCDKNVYLPSEDAAISFKVTTRKGVPTLAALGVMIVDESVFALQEMQPGMEKIYFYLEKELAQPRYEIHGYAIEDVVSPQPLAKEGNREMAAKVLLASAEGAKDYGISVNTFTRDNKGQGYQQYISQRLMTRYQKVQEAVNRFSEAYKKDEQKHIRQIDWTESQPFTLRVLTANGFLKEKDITDPWGNVFEFKGSWCTSCKTVHSFQLMSYGPDGRKGTEDDIFLPNSENGRGGVRLIGGDMVDMVRAEDVRIDEKAKVLAPVSVMAVTAPLPSVKPAAGPEPPRIRQYFPETLYFNPLLITDEQGRASTIVKMADSITTWRLTGMASSLAGELGSITQGIRVFQDFFIDIDFPVSLVQNDEVSVPVAVYNYLAKPQTVKLKVQKENWFDLSGEPEKALELNPNEVSVCYFTIKARKIGNYKFTVFGYGSKMSDAVSRTIEIEPDGKECLVNFTGRLEKEISHDVIIPDGAIEDAGKIFVKIYPGILSQVVEGMDSLLRMPSGCFEQTSSVTYPNVLVLDYMKSTKQVTPELAMKAEGFINTGYQRLLSYEVPGGGFEWFGKAPAHKILTAYGLMEFYDMSRVYEVDRNVIARTQQWLIKQQEKDGSWKPSAGGISEGAINKFAADVLRNTAYVVWALSATEYKGESLDKGIAYIKDHRKDIKDNYTLALCALSLLTADEKDAVGTDLLGDLADKKIEKDDAVYWETEGETPTYGKGNTASIETTAIACQALLKSGKYRPLVSKINTYLIKNKDSYGSWQSTQATIQAFKALLGSIKDSTQRVNAKITISINGKTASEIKVDQTNSEILQLIDLKDQTKSGSNKVVLGLEGEGSMFYQIVGRYYLPYGEKVHETEPLAIDVNYDRTQLRKDDIITSTVTIKNNRPAAAKMVIIDLGLPPGFDVLTEDLTRLVDDKTVQKFSVTGRQIILYLDEISANGTFILKYRLKAKYPIKAKTAKSTVYEYYNPDVSDTSLPQEIVVER